MVSLALILSILKTCLCNQHRLRNVITFKLGVTGSSFDQDLQVSYTHEDDRLQNSQQLNAKPTCCPYSHPATHPSTKRTPAEAREY